MENYECPIIEIIEFSISIYTSVESSDVVNPAPGGSGSTGWLPWV